MQPGREPCAPQPIRALPEPGRVLQRRVGWDLVLGDAPILEESGTKREAICPWPGFPPSADYVCGQNWHRRQPAVSAGASHIHAGHHKEVPQELPQELAPGWLHPRSGEQISGRDGTKQEQEPRGDHSVVPPSPGICLARNRPGSGRRDCHLVATRALPEADEAEN